MFKKMQKNVLGLVETGMALGIGSQALSQIPGTGNAQVGLANVAAQLPAMGSIIGAGMALGAVEDLTKKSKKWL